MEGVDCVIRILLPVVTFCVIGLTPNFIFSPFWFLNMILYLMIGFAVIHFAVYSIKKQHMLGVSVLLFLLWQYLPLAVSDTAFWQLL